MLPITVQSHLVFSDNNLVEEDEPTDFSLGSFKDTIYQKANMKIRKNLSCDGRNKHSQMA